MLFSDRRNTSEDRDNRSRLYFPLYVPRSFFKLRVCVAGKMELPASQHYPAKPSVKRCCKPSLLQACSLGLQVLTGSGWVSHPASVRALPLAQERHQASQVEFLPLYSPRSIGLIHLLYTLKQMLCQVGQRQADPKLSFSSTLK